MHSPLILLQWHLHLLLPPAAQLQRKMAQLVHVWPIICLMMSTSTCICSKVDHQHTVRYVPHFLSHRKLRNSIPWIRAFLRSFWLGYLFLIHIMWKSNSVPVTTTTTINNACKKRPSGLEKLCCVLLWLLFLLFQRITWDPLDQDRELCLLKGKSEVSWKNHFLLLLAGSVGRFWMACTN